MDPLRTFFMEDYLERSRFTARFNLGESGHRHRTVGELLRGAGLSDADAAQIFLQTPLRDSPNWGREDLREAVARMHPGASVDNVLITTGTSEALLLLFRQLKPKKVALVLPAFQLLYELPQSLGARIVGLPLSWDAAGVPSVPQAQWREILDREQPECVVINNPHNPSGIVFSDEVLGMLTGWAEANEATVVGDEHYRLLSSDEGPLGPTVYRPGQRSFVTGSFIKCLGCPGLRIGWCVGDTATLAAMQNEKNYTTHTVNPVSEWISWELLRTLDSAALRQARDEWKHNRQLLSAFLQGSPGFYGVAPAGGIVCCVGFRNVHTGAQYETAMRGMQEAGVFVLPLSAMEHGSPSGRHPLDRGHGFRMGVGIAPLQMSEALQAMEDALRAAA